MFELLKNPSLHDWLEQDWACANLAIEEFLRFLSPVQFSKPRYVRKNVMLDGVELKKGDKITTLRSGRGSISASAINSRASRANVRFRLCSGAGQNSRWLFRRNA